MLHLYALTGVEPAVDPVAGIDRAPVRFLRSGSFHAVISEHDRAPSATGAAPLQHAGVVGWLLPLAPTLPVRFGSVHHDRDGLQRALAAARDELQAALGRVGGHVEFAARLELSGRPPAAAVPDARAAADGRGYLERRLASQRAQEAWRLEVERRLVEATGTLAGLANGAHVRAARGGPERCFLVPLDRIDEFRGAAGALDAEELAVVGPFPPFSFAEEAEGDDRG